MVKRFCFTALAAILMPSLAFAQQPQPSAQQQAAQRVLNAMNQYAIAVAIDDKCDFLLSFERIVAEAAVSKFHQQLVRAGAKPSELEQHKKTAIGQISQLDCTALGQTNGVLSLKQEIQRNTGGMLKRFEKSPWYICNRATKAMVTGADAKPKQDRIEAYIAGYLASLSDVPNWATVSKKASETMTITFPDGDPACKAMLNIHALAELQSNNPGISSVREFTLAKAYRGKRQTEPLDFAVMETARAKAEGGNLRVRYGFLRDGRFAFDFHSSKGDRAPRVYGVSFLPEATGTPMVLGKRQPSLDRDENRQVIVLSREEAGNMLGASYREGELLGIEIGVKRDVAIGDRTEQRFVKFDKRSMAHNLVNALTYATVPPIIPSK